MYIHLGTLLFETPASGFFPLIFEKNNNGLDSVTRETGASSRLRPRSRAGAMTDDVDQRAPYDRTKAKEGDTVFIFAGTLTLSSRRLFPSHTRTASRSE